MGCSIARAALVAVVGAAALGAALMHAETTRADSLPCQAPNRGFDFDTKELPQAQYGTAFELAAAGKAAPAPYTLANGEYVDVSFQGLESGPRSARQGASTAVGVPPSLFKAIGWIESGWSNGTKQVPYGGVGPLIVSGDCGYGVAQITSGMGQFGGDALEPGVPSARQALIGTNMLYNLSEGIRILAGKWNIAPELRPIAGNGNPAMLEDWYYAIWGYNGFAFSNHPLNPNLDPLRGGSTATTLYHCYDPSAPGYGTGYGPGNYTYAERVYGCLRSPPKAQQGSALTAAEDAGPRFKPGDSVTVTGTGADGLNIRSAPAGSVVATVPDGASLTILGEPQTAGGYVWWNVTTSGGVTGWSVDQFLAPVAGPPPDGEPTPPPPPPVPPVVDPAGRLWAPQVFNVPYLGNPLVAAAFKPANYLACDSATNFGEGCSAMDFPTTIAAAGLAPHPDTTPAVNPSLAAALLGAPQLQYSGPTEASLTAFSDGTSSSTTITVTNEGTGVGSFRVRTSAGWIAVRHPGDPAGRTLDGGVAVGSETEVVIQQSPKVTLPGFDSVLKVTLDASIMPPGTSEGWVLIEPLLGGGSVFKLNISATNHSVPPPALQFRTFAPGVTSSP